MLLWFPYLSMKSIGETSSQISVSKSMSRSLSVHQSINSDNYENAISLYMPFMMVSCEARTVALEIRGYFGFNQRRYFCTSAGRFQNTFIVSSKQMKLDETCQCCCTPQSRLSLTTDYKHELIRYELLSRTKTLIAATV